MTVTAEVDICWSVVEAEGDTSENIKNNMNQSVKTASERSCKYYGCCIVLVDNLTDCM